MGPCAIMKKIEKFKYLQKMLNKFLKIVVDNGKVRVCEIAEMVSNWKCVDDLRRPFTVCSQ